jgi:predicted dehydrogenase
MKIAFIGVQHWHAKHYYIAVSKLSKYKIVGISDPNQKTLDEISAHLEAPGYTDYRELISKQKPDFVFIFAPHNELASTTQFVIDQGIACLVEKPGGMNQQEVAYLRVQAEKKSLHVATGFNFRVSDFYKQVMAMIEHEQVTFASFRFIAGGPARYRESGNSWMLNPALSGGGSTINLSVHFFDMFRQFTKSEPTEITSLMGNHTWQLPIEDYSSVIVRSPKALCTIETGYTFPATPQITFDLRFCVRTNSQYLIASGDGSIQIQKNATHEIKTIQTPSNGNAYWYPTFVEETLERFDQEKPPIGNLFDLEMAVQMVDAAYASNRSNGKIQHYPFVTK